MKEMREIDTEKESVISKETIQGFRDMSERFLEMKREIAEQKKVIGWYKLNFELITYCVLRFTGTFGLNNKEDTMIRQTILDGDESPMGAVLKNITGLMSDAMMAEANPTKKKQMEEKFRFFFYLPWVAKFYEWQKQIKSVFTAEELKDLPEVVKAELLK